MHPSFEELNWDLEEKKNKSKTQTGLEVSAGSGFTSWPLVIEWSGAVSANAGPEGTGWIVIQFHRIPAE